MKKVRRYNEGDLVEPGSGVVDEMDDEALRRSRRAMSSEEMAGPATFGQAFKEARARGDKTFDFGGKKYTTEMKSDKPSYRRTSGADKSPEYASAPAKKQSIYDSSRDPVVQGIKSAMTRSSEARTPTVKPFSARDVDPKTLLPRRQYAAGGKVLSASKRADGCAQRGKTRGKMV